MWWCKEGIKEWTVLGPVCIPLNPLGEGVDKWGWVRNEGTFE
ncbi:hypothetical protein Ct9H90mP29_07490 [bacterium]|nr:MAG: hypothetical protein Ct9H90mP29_07490 [bacterium]